MTLLSVEARRRLEGAGRMPPKVSWTSLGPCFLELAEYGAGQLGRSFANIASGQNH